MWARALTQLTKTPHSLREYHMKWSKSDRERQILDDITYMRNLKNNTNDFIYKTEQTQRHRKQLMVTKGEREIRSMGLTDTHYYI